jgi:hypothetical protein
MSFNPNLPVNNTIVDADLLRGQFNALKALIDSGGNGQQGPPGTDGVGIAEVRDSGDGSGRAIVILTDGREQGPFTIAGGPPGAQGERGEKGDQGEPGPEGRHVTNVRDNGDGRAVVVMSDGGEYGPFVVASGPAGANGADGRGISDVADAGDGRVVIHMSDGSAYGPWAAASGPQGPEGPQGPSGEVTSDQLNSAIGGTSANTNGVGTLDSSSADPDMESLRQKLNELINALRR